MICSVSSAYQMTSRYRALGSLRCVPMASSVSNWNLPLDISTYLVSEFHRIICYFPASPKASFCCSSPPCHVCVLLLRDSPPSLYTCREFPGRLSLVHRCGICLYVVHVLITKMISLKAFHSTLPAILMNKFFMAMLRNEKKILNRRSNSSLLTFKWSSMKED